MRLRILGGWSLIVAGLTLLLRLLVGAIVNGDVPPILLGMDEILSLLFLLGLPAIQATQPHTGRRGQIGLWCLGLAAGLAFIVRAIVLMSTIDIGVAVPFISALLALTGSVLVGWVTIQARVFSSVVGWLLIAGGLLNFVGGLTPTGAITTALGVIGVLAQAGAEIGYGWGIVSRARGRLPSVPNAPADAITGTSM